MLLRTMIVSLLVVALGAIASAKEDNLLRNPEFVVAEGGVLPIDWSTWVPAGSTVSFDVVGDQGDRVVRIVSDSSTGRGTLRQMDIPVTPGNVYRVFAEYKSNLSPGAGASEPGRVAIRMQWFRGPVTGANHIQVDYDTVVSDMNDGMISLAGGNVHVFGGDNGGEWTSLSLDVRAPQDAQYMIVELFLWNAIGEVRWRSPALNDVTGEYDSADGAVPPAGEGEATPTRASVWDTFDIHPPSIFSMATLRERIGELAESPGGAGYFKEGRPSLYAPVDEIARVRKLVLEDDLYAAWSVNIVTRANQLVGQPIDDPDWQAWVNRDRTEVQFVARDLKSRLETLGFAFLLTEETSYAETARRLMLQAASWPRWTHSRISWERWTGEIGTDYQAMLPTGEMAMAMGTAYDWFYHYLSDVDRARIRDAIVEMAILPIVREWADPATRIHPNPWNNWYAVILGGGGVAALSVLNEHPQSATWVELLKSALVEWFEFPGDRREYWFGNWQNDTAPNFDPDGMYGEGFTYLSYGMSYALYFMKGLADVTGDTTLLKVPAIANLPRMILWGTYYGSGGARVVNFNDSGEAPPPAEVLVGLATLLQSGELQWYFRQTRLLDANALSVLWHDPELEPVSPAQSEAYQSMGIRFRTFGWALARTGWSGNAAFFALKSGRRVSHGHRDAASFIYYAGGSPLLIDSTLRADYTDPVYRDWDVQTRAHNTILVDGRGQSGYGELGAFVSAPGITYVQAIAGGAYDQLTLFDRHALFFGDEGNLVILDEIGSLRPVAVDWLVHAAGLRAPDVSENRMTIQGGRVDLAGTVIAPDRFDFKLMPVADGRPERFLSVAIPREAGTRNVMVVFTPYQRRLGPPAIQATRLAGSSNGDVVRFEGSSGLHYMVSHNLGSTGTVWSLEREQAGVALTTDASIVYTATDADGTLVNALMTNGTHMAVDERDVLRLDHRCTAAVSYGLERIAVSLYCNEESTAYISTGSAPVAVQLNRLMAGPLDTQWGYDEGRREVWLRVPSSETEAWISL